jgi:protocatechuate 3,4-dioxygenase beta subunit
MGWTGNSSACPVAAQTGHPVRAPKAGAHFRQRTRRANGRRNRSITVEQLEARQLMAADIRVGAVYAEKDAGSDVDPDKFYITFDGGAPNTQLRRIVMNADLYDSGLSRGDLIFDTEAGGLGADGFHPFRIVELQTKNPNASVRASVEDGSSHLVLEFTNFVAGDRLVFSIDVDEVVHLTPGETNRDRINEGIDPITSGIEFQGTKFTAQFTAPHYQDVGGTETFLNFYDRVLDPLELPLPRDDFNGLRDRTTGAGLKLKQLPKPISVAGKVWVDNDEDLNLDPGEQLLPAVRMELFVLQGLQYVSTGHNTLTNGQGQYSFGTELGLQPGVYQVRQTQPDGYYSVGAKTGRLTTGTPVGSLVPGNPDLLTQIALDLGDSHAIELNFAENRPNRLGGHVCYVISGMDCFSVNSQKAPQANVLVELLNSAGEVIAQTRTATDGTYSFENLRAGNYRLRQTNLDGRIDGGARQGTIGGNVTDPNNITQIILGGGDNAINYDFCDLVPAEISGHVYFDANNNGRRETGETPLPNVLVQLWNESGQLVGTTRTNELGFYKFENLRPGIYRVTETTPDGYSPGQASAGSEGGQTDATGDVIHTIELGSGVKGVNYDFGELLLGSIQGRVIVDINGNCIVDALGEMPLPGVRVELLDQNGTIVSTTLTDSEGKYRFEELTAGRYSVREVQPAGYFQGGQRAGSGGGDASVVDLISAIDILPGSNLVDYDFCELPPSSLSGFVFVDRDADCTFDQEEPPISGVTVTLLDQTGSVVAATVTDARGHYSFGGLRPGNYSVRQTQPGGYLQGGQKAGSAGGDDSLQDLISSITIAPGATLIEYNFCEREPAKLSGFVFQDGPVFKSAFGDLPDPTDPTYNGQRTADDTPLSGVIVRLYLPNGQPAPASLALPGIYTGQFIETVTDANGYYEFAGLPAGTYLLLEIQPADYTDWIDTPGTTGGRTLLSPDQLSAFQQQVGDQTAGLSQFAVDELMDAIVGVSVRSGEHSQENNFSELKVQLIPPPPPPPPPVVNLERPNVGRETFPRIQPILWQPITWSPLPLIVGGGHLPEMTWHLSVVNGGYPRGARTGEVVSSDTVQEQADYLDFRTWTVRGMKSSHYRHISTTNNNRPLEESSVFYVPEATPLMGDFNGDGYDELALFLSGEWFIDINANGRWDEHDIWLRLGTKSDQPVVGDWDGDGKDDIGIFGRKWNGDDRAIAAEPGMPDPENFVQTKRPKNVPRHRDETPDAPRLMQPSRNGNARADVIDHVFRLGAGRDIAVSGDFNGDGVSNVGTFRDGKWSLDSTGNGKPDQFVELGQPGDQPLVGDFNGDGVDELAIVRGNQVLVDSNRNGRFDATDQVFMLESNQGKVIVGDFNGDGTDEPALYQSPDRSLQARHTAG